MLTSPRSLLLLSLLAPTFGLMVASAAPPKARHGKVGKAKPAVATKSTAPDTFGKEVGPLIKQFCGSCHGEKEGTAGLSLLAFHNTADIIKSRSEWEKVSQNIASGHMPPVGTPQPTKAQRDALVAWIDGTLSKAECDIHDPGHVTMRRLNRAEYNNTIRDLTGFDLHPADSFPNDDVGYGFDNIGDVLSMSPLQMEKYLAAAEQVAQVAVVTPEMARKPVSISASLFTQNGQTFPSHERGWMLGTSGSEAGTDYDFAAGGEYNLNVLAYGEQAGTEPARMTIRLDGKEVKTTDVTGTRRKPDTIPFSITTTPGKHRVSFVFLNDFYQPAPPAEPGKKAGKTEDRNLVVNGLEITRPKGVSDPLPVSNRRIIFVLPKSPAEYDACTRRVLGAFARRAYRRPVSAAEVDRFVRYVKASLGPGESWERGIQMGVTAILASPNFLFRVETDPNPNVKTAHALNGFELASRLSYFLWSSMPDEELFTLAAKESLQKPNVLAAQVQRMLRDPRSKALADNFAGQWLQLRSLANVSPDTNQFKDFNNDLRKAMRTETEMFFEAIVHEDRPVMDFLDAKFTYLNEPLAKHYGIGGITGDNFRRVTLSGDQRGGILTQASVLTVTSNPTRTSPVKRGKWVLENIFNTPPPPPPPNVAQLADDKHSPLEGTLRQRMEQHRSNPACASCHARMDPIGFGLENYDATGGWRTVDGKYPVDSSGILYGQKFTTPAELKVILKTKKPEFVRCLTEKLMTYGLGRGLDSRDHCNVDALVAKAAKGEYKFSAIVGAIVQSEPFRKRRGDSEHQTASR